MQEMNEEERIESENNVTIYKDTFTLSDLKSGLKRIQVLRKKFIPEIIENVEKRFENLDDFKALNLFNVSLWNNLNEDDVELMKLDSTKLDGLAVIMKAPPDMYTFDLKEAKKEWKKVKRIVIRQYLHYKIAKSICGVILYIHMTTFFPIFHSLLRCFS